MASMSASRRRRLRTTLTIRTSSTTMAAEVAAATSATERFQLARTEIFGDDRIDHQRNTATRRGAASRRVSVPSVNRGLSSRTTSSVLPWTRMTIWAEPVVLTVPIKSSLWGHRVSGMRSSR